MTDTGNDAPVGPISVDLLKPYASFAVFECRPDSVDAAFDLLMTTTLRVARNVRVGTVALVNFGLEGLNPYLTTGAAGVNGMDQANGIVYRTIRPPSWAQPGPDYTDVRNLLALVLRKGKLLVLCGEGPLRESVVNLLHRQPQMLLRLVAADILQGAFLSGDGKVLWLRGAHARRSTKADSKQLGGTNLREALNPLDDNSFSLKSAKAAMPADPGRVELVGNVGTTPVKGTVWNRSTQSFGSFVRLVSELMAAIERTAATGSGLDRPFPYLAVTSFDLAGVFDAYDMAAVPPDSLPADPDVDPDVTDAAELLERAVMIVHGQPGSADFTVDVGLDGVVAGTILAQPTSSRSGVHFKFGPQDGATHPERVREILDALERSADLYQVYYDSGHTIAGGTIVSPGRRPEPYKGWNWRNFAGFDITREKPDSKIPQEIHDAIGLAGDRSLFGWVLQNYGYGHLTCDDGTGEIADFLHIGPDRTLTFIHVKGASSSSSNRQVAVGAYELVASQAVKNLTLLTTDQIRQRLEPPIVKRPATWFDGRRVGDRTLFLDALSHVGPQDDKSIVIVQPHMSRTLYDRLRADPTGSTDNHYRLQLLETLLNGSRATAIAVGGEMTTIAAQS